MIMPFEHSSLPSYRQLRVKRFVNGVRASEATFATTSPDRYSDLINLTLSFKQLQQAGQLTWVLVQQEEERWQGGARTGLAMETLRLQ